jgi:hypothetical protein
MKFETTTHALHDGVCGTCTAEHFLAYIGPFFPSNSLDPTHAETNCRYATVQ